MTVSYFCSLSLTFDETWPESRQPRQAEIGQLSHLILLLLRSYLYNCFHHAIHSDIAGFTAWSSVREPTQVFTLLEKIYGSFDKIAKKRRVFKVETIGDW